MAKVSIEPGICGFTALVTAHSEDRHNVELSVTSGCEAVQKMMQELGHSFNAFELCLVRPGCGPLYHYAAQHFPAHCACPVIAGITKCAEAECKLAIKKDASIRFLPE